MSVPGYLWALVTLGEGEGQHRTGITGGRSRCEIEVSDPISPDTRARVVSGPGLGISAQPAMWLQLSGKSVHTLKAVQNRFVRDFLFNPKGLELLVFRIIYMEVYSPQTQLWRVKTSEEGFNFGFYGIYSNGIKGCHQTRHDLLLNYFIVQLNNQSGSHTTQH